MADASETAAQTATETDIFQTLKKVNESLVEVLRSQMNPAGTVYLQNTPATTSQAGQPNYLIWLGVGLLAVLLFMRKGR